jgi:hypothetical protein
MSEGADELAHHLTRALRLGCSVEFDYPRTWLGTRVRVRKLDDNVVYENSKIISDKEMVCVSEPMRLLANAIKDLVNSIEDMENAQ